MASISCALDRIKRDLRPFLSDGLIESVATAAGHEWRERQMGPVETVHLFVLQILNFNTAMTHLRHLSRQAFKAPAYCRARMRLPLGVLQALLVQSSAAMRKASCSPEALWCGLRAHLVDGSSTIAPDTPGSQKAFGQPKGCRKGCGFPVPKVLGLFDAFSGLIVQVLGFPLYTHEQSKAWMLHPLLGAGDLLVGDRGFCSFVHFALLSSRGVQGLFRLHQRTIVDFRPHRRRHRKGEKAQKGKPVPRSKFIERLAWHDQIVEWFKPDIKPKWMSKKQFKQLPASLRIRELRIVIPCKGQRTQVLTIATTLLDPIAYSKKQIMELYEVRWRVETHYAQLKTLLKMRKLKSKTSDGVLKELAVYALVYNLIHMVMLKAAERQGVLPHRISFIDTVRWLLTAHPGESLPDLMIVPHRPGRHEPRVTKDQMDTYTKMSRPRAELKKELKKKPLKT